MRSCIYEGTVTHCRHEPVIHKFQYRLFMVYLDLDELRWTVGRHALIGDRNLAARSFVRSDHLFDTNRSLADELRQLIFRQTGSVARGPIRLLTQLRYFGYFMSPLNLFYVFDELDQGVEFIVAEVNNTPWNERHCYVLWKGNGTVGDGQHHFAHRKEFHVSPFMSMDVDYRWRIGEPGRDLQVYLANYQCTEKIFDAAMMLRCRELTRQQLRRMTIRYPLMTAQITGGIYNQAFKLWWKKCPFYKHPKTLNKSLEPAQTVSGLPNTTSNTAR